jgi:hypothetical protein
MSGAIHPFPTTAGASRQTGAKKRDTSEACRARASADLLKSVTMLTANERLVLERSASSWIVRADLLDRVEATARVKQSPSSTPEGMSA